MSDQNKKAAPEHVVKGKVYVQKPSALQKLYNIFFCASPIEVAKGLVKYVLVPDAKYTLNNLWSEAGNMMSYGVEEGRGRGNQNNGYHYNYSNPNMRNGGRRQRNQNNNSGSEITGITDRADVWKYIELSTRRDCESVIIECKDYVGIDERTGRLKPDHYDYLTVGDLISAIVAVDNNLNIESHKIHYEWGWPVESLMMPITEYYEVTRGGRYKMRMPKMVRIK